MRLIPLALLACSVILAGCSPSPPPSTATQKKIDTAGGKLRVTFLDVGQGDAALIQAPGGESALIDGGPSEAGDTVVSALHQAGVDRLDLVVGSHPHEDHIGGLIDVLRQVPVAQALDPGYAHGTATQRTYLRLLKEKQVKTTRARSGQVIQLGEDVRLEILSPAEPLLEGTDSDANNNSIVARLTHGGSRFLFTGDMEEAQRARLLGSVPGEQLQSQVLKVAHHGSHNGTDRQFLRAVRPTYAVISLSRDNDYGHPHAEALEALQDAGARILRTDELGALTFTSDGTRIELSTVPAATVKRKAPAPDRGGKMIGSRSSRVFHAPDCPRLPGPGNRVELPSAQQAREDGFRPHATCVRNRGRSR